MMGPNEEGKLNTQGTGISTGLFDPKAGSLLEHILFNNRVLVLIICVFVTMFLGYQAMTKLHLNASYEKMLPVKHPYIMNYLKYKEEIGESGNAFRIVVENTRGSIYSTAYLETLRRMSDELFLVPGVFRPFMKSLWTPNTRWSSITEQGLDGGPVIPQDFDGAEKTLEQMRIDVGRANLIGQLVALDHNSSMIYLPLLSYYPNGEPLDYGKLNANMESLRDKYEKEGVRIYITGFPKIVGNLITALNQIVLFFSIAMMVTFGFVYWYTRCLRSTLLVVSCSLLAVVWLLGIMPSIGIVLDPYSILVPFLVFSIGMSHGSQKMNGILQDVGRGSTKLIAARNTFRRLFLPGVTALTTDALGFAVMAVITIPVIQELAISASIGVAVLIFTNLMVIPILLSFTGVNPKAARRALQAEIDLEAKVKKHPVWGFLDFFTQRKWAVRAIGVGIALAVFAYVVSLQLTVGDLDPGAPELRPDSRYNQDNVYLTRHYGASSDVFGVIIAAPPFEAQKLENLGRVDALEWELINLEGVEYTNSMALFVRRLQLEFSEGNPKYYELVPNQPLVNVLSSRTPRGDLVNEDFSLLNLNAYLEDHKAETLSRVMRKVEDFASQYNTKDCQFLMSSGNAGIEAASNIVVSKANRKMVFIIYSATIFLCYVTFMSWRGVLVAVIPLMLTSLLGEAVMVWLRIGVKVATLPVIALGVGIGVDYAIYMLSITLARLKEGMSLSEAYYRALLFTGRVVILIGLTLSFSVATWYFSPIKFQADMGVLLAFMFLWNMVGALIFLPSLGCFLLKTNKRS